MKGENHAQSYLDELTIGLPAADVEALSGNLPQGLLTDSYANLERLKEKIPKPVRDARLMWALERLVMLYETDNFKRDSEELQKYKTLLENLRRSKEAAGAEKQEKDQQP